MNEPHVNPSSEGVPKCPQCGTPLPVGALAGLCPACLLMQGAAEDTNTAGTHPFNPPTIAELAPLFPQLDILELIGKGGMGAVYKARQKQLDRVVALKILPPGIGNEPTFAERFAREAKALAKLNHPNIVTIYDFGVASDSQLSTHNSQLFYFLMEFVDGVTLRQLLNTGRVSAHEALAIVPQICDALQFAHDHGIVHRDIKPENILMDRRGRVKVADFGLAKIVEGNAPLTPSLSRSDEKAPKPSEGPALTDANRIMGTPNYMAPEQIESPTEVDHRADIYALGVVFYQMLTGELPGKKIEAPSKKVSIDVRLDEVVLRALERKPDLRYQQASVLKTQVETIAETPLIAEQASERKSVGKNFRTQQTIFGLPWVHLAWGMDPATNKPRVAQGVIAIGPEARGVISVGLIAFGVFPVGVLATGLFPVGFVAIGFLAVGLAAAGLQATGLFAFAIGTAVGLAAIAPKPVALAKLVIDRDTVLGGWVFVVLFAWSARKWISRTIHFGYDSRASVPFRIPPMMISGIISVVWLLFGLTLLLIGNFTNVESRWWGYWLLGLCLVPSAAYLIELYFRKAAQLHPARPSPAKSPLVRIVEILSGITITSPRSVFLINVSTLGFLGFLTYLSDLPFPQARIFKAFSGAFGLFGLIGVAFAIEFRARRKNSRFSEEQEIITTSENKTERINRPAVNCPIAMDAWLALMDTGEYARSWEVAAPYFQRSVSKEEWIARLEKVRRPLGEVLSRKPVSIKQTVAGTRYEAIHETSFDGLLAATETVTYAKQPNGEWKPIGYLIRSAEVRSTRKWLVPLALSPVAVLAILFAVSTFSHKNSEAARVALQVELGNKIAALLGDQRRTTYSHLTFEHVPNTPWKAIVHFGGLQSWRDSSNQPLAQPRQIKGDLVLDFHPPNQWTVSGTGDLYGLDAVWNTSQAGFPNWRDSRGAGDTVTNDAFGAVVDQTLPLNDLGYSPSFNFESGEMELLPASLTMDDWAKGVQLPTGIIVIAPSVNRALTIAGTGTRVRPLLHSAAVWDHPKPIDLDIDNPTPGQTESVTGESSSPPVTFAFKTRTGSRGLLQITGFATNPPSVKIRYKLVEKSAPATSNQKTNEINSVSYKFKDGRVEFTDPSRNLQFKAGQIVQDIGNGNWMILDGTNIVITNSAPDSIRNPSPILR